MAASQETIQATFCKKKVEPSPEPEPEQTETDELPDSPISFSDEMEGSSQPLSPDVPVDPPQDPEFTGTPSGGTSFQPMQFDGAMQEKSPVVDPKKIPPHLIEVLPLAKQARAFQREIMAFKKRVLEYAETKAGSYLHAQDVERLCDQIKVNIKETAFEVNCPRCKNHIVRTCPRCEGRGFVNHGQLRTLTDPDRAWLKTQVKLSEDADE